MARNDGIVIEGTRFIYKTNFSGDPTRDRFGSSVRKGNVIIPSPEQAAELAEMGCNVKTTQPREGFEDEFVPVNYVNIVANYESYDPPQIFLVSGDADPVLVDPEALSEIDSCYVLNVDVVLNPNKNQNTGRTSLYIRRMYVQQDVAADPFASKYWNRK